MHLFNRKTNTMKKQIILLVSLLIFSTNYSLQAQKANSKKKSGYEIKIHIKNSPDSMMYLANYYGRNQYLKDSAKADAKTPGLFVFKGEEPLLGGIYILASQAKVKTMEFVIDQSQHFTFETDTADVLKQINVKGSTENELFFNYIKVLNHLQNELMRINGEVKDAENEGKEGLVKIKKDLLTEKSKELEEYTKGFIKDNPDAFFSKVLALNLDIKIPPFPVREDGTVDSTFAWRYYKENFWMHTDLTDDRLLRTPVFHSKLQRYFSEVIVQDNDSIKHEATKIIEKVRPNEEMFKYVIWFLTNFYETSKIMGHDEIFVYLVEEYYMTNQCFWVAPHTLENLSRRALQLKNILIGAKAPELVMYDTNNVFRSTYQINADYTILWFFDPDCGHCKVETPRLRDFYNKNKEKLNLEVFAVSSDQDLERWKKYIRDQKLNWINVGGNTANIDFFKIYDLYSTPVMFLLDKDKKILAKRISVADLDNFFEQYEKVKENRKRMGMD